MDGSSIFDYTSLPEFQKWVNSGKYDGANLSSGQSDLRDWYGKLISVLQQPAFTNGEFYGLNHANQGNQKFGRMFGEAASGHWLYAFLRFDKASGQGFLCVVNFHPDHAFRDVEVIIPDHALGFLKKKTAKKLSFSGKLGTRRSISAEKKEKDATSVQVGELPPFAVHYYELK